MIEKGNIKILHSSRGAIIFNLDGEKYFITVEMLLPPDNKYACTMNPCVQHFDERATANILVPKGPSVKEGHYEALKKLVFYALESNFLDYIELGVGRKNITLTKENVYRDFPKTIAYQMSNDEWLAQMTPNAWKLMKLMTEGREGKVLIAVDPLIETESDFRNMVDELKKNSSEDLRQNTAPRTDEHEANYWEELWETVCEEGLPKFIIMRGWERIPKKLSDEVTHFENLIEKYNEKFTDKHCALYHIGEGEGMREAAELVFGEDNSA
jgi:hypothetical protein